MWTCTKCGEVNEDQFDACWKCSTARSADAVSTETPAGKQTWRMSYRVFRGTFATWDELFKEAAEFASYIGPERVISISHSEDKDDGVVAVWYWSDATNAAGSQGGA